MSSFADIPSYTWGNRPAASSVPVGTLIRISDVGASSGGIYMVSDGVSTWSAAGPQSIARSSVAASVTGTTSETALATVTVPGSLMGLHAGLEIRTAWTFTNSANAKTPRVRLGGIAGTTYYAPTITTSNSTASINRIRNRGSASSQVGSSAVGASGGAGAQGQALPTSAADSTQALDLAFTGQLALGSETTTLESYEVWLLP